MTYLIKIEGKISVQKVNVEELTSIERVTRDYAQCTEIRWIKKGVRASRDKSQEL